MNSLPDLSAFNFAPVMDYPEDPGEIYVFDFSRGYDPDFIPQKNWGIGKYNESRKDMYVAPQFNRERNIHMGVDIWTAAGASVYSFFDGVVAYQQNNAREGDYGPTTVVRYGLGQSRVYALYGHLSRESLEMVEVGDRLAKGEQLGVIGKEAENGGWVPHLHFQLSLEDPGEADMPGVVAERDRRAAMKKFLDPRLVLGALY